MWNDFGNSAGLGVQPQYGGLPAAFLIAGAKAVVSSLWAVNDASSTLLMSEFYRRHLVEGQDVQTALRGVQLWLRQVTTSDLRAWLKSKARDYPFWVRSHWPTWWAIWRLRRALGRLDKARQPFKAVDRWAAYVALSYTQ